MFTDDYLKLLANKNISKICSKPYGLEFMILLYFDSKHNNENGIEEIFEMIQYNRCKRPAFLSFIKDLSDEVIVLRSPSKLKKSRTLLRLNQDIVRLLDKINCIDH